MRTFLLWLSAVITVFFAISFALTFFARGYISGLAEGFVIDRTKKYADPMVEITEQAIKAPGAQRAFGDEIVATTRREIDEYRTDPRGYIAKLVAGDGQPPAANPGKEGALKDKVTFWKSEIREYFDKTLNRLLFDLRIFFGSNLVAALLALVLAWQARADRLPRLLLFCGLLLASVAFSTYMYIDEFSYFKILFNTYLGWWYPALLGITFLSLIVDHGRTGQVSANK